MRTLFVLVAPPGAGKSTWAINNMPKIKGATRIVSRDKIRFELVKENEGYFSKEKQVFAQFSSTINSDLENGYNVIADATHLSAASRRKLINSLNPKILKDTKIVAIVIDENEETCLVHNEARLGTRRFVPEDVIKNMCAKFEKPNFYTDEFFDEIYTYKNNKYSIKELV